jgi:hypothetical protein
MPTIYQVSITATVTPEQWNKLTDAELEPILTAIEADEKLALFITSATARLAELAPGMIVKNTL